MTTAPRFRSAARRGAVAVTTLIVLAGCSTAVAGRPRVGDDLPTRPATSVTIPGSSGTEPLPAGTSVGGTSGHPGPAASSPAPVHPPPAPSAAAPSPTTGATPPGPATSPLPDGGVAGAPGAGDPYYPTAGNGGYQVDGCDITLNYLPEHNQLDATARIKATITSTQPLGRFNLDLQPDLTVSSVSVDDAPAPFDHHDAELVITPSKPAAPRSTLTVEVTYSGNPGMISERATALGDGGWYRTKDGGALAAGEPFSASAWYPVNEHPSDPATFSVTATVPDGWQVIANGTKFDGALPAPPHGMHSVRYSEKRPIASYLTTILIDRLTFTTGTFDGKPIVNAFTSAGASKKPLAESTAKVLAVLSKHFGPFPFDSYGGIYSGENLPFALETATRPVYASWVDLDTVVHETAHQWYGDDVMLARWRDVCLNECFASYAPWLYHQDVDGADLDKAWQADMAKVAGDASFWASPLVDMGAGNEFTSVYDRGPLAIHALRHEMGEDAFAALLTGWVVTYGGKNASFDDLESFASSLAGKDLRPFMDAWFRGTVVPPEPYRTPPGLG